MSDRPSVRERLARALFGDVIDARVKAALASVSIRVDDSPGWESRTAPGPLDTPWGDRYQDLEDVLEAWRKNFFIRRIVTLTRSYVVGNGITISSKDSDVAAFISSFWSHPQNKMGLRIKQMCDELTRTGEVFPTLHMNRVDGMSYVRCVPAIQIREIDVAPNDYEQELRYGQSRRDTVELRWWIGPHHKHAFGKARGAPGGHLKPLMLHWAVNRPVGAVRGEGDLTPVLPWAKRYGEWLKDRVRLNRIRTRQAMLDVEVADDSMVEEKRRQLRTSNPVEHGIYVHGKGEKATLHRLDIEAGDVKDDGRALRLAVATGANVGLHFLSEGESVNYATAREMGEPTALFYSDRQGDLLAFLKGLVSAAYRRKCALGLGTWPDDGDLQLTHSVAQIAREDNLALAQATAAVVEALVAMRDAGWIDDVTAATMAFKFAGEPVGRDEVERMLGDEETGRGGDKERGGK